MAYELTKEGKRKADAGLLVSIHGELVNLAGKAVTVELQESPRNPKGTKREYKSANQKHLKAYFDMGGHRLVQKVDNKSNEESNKTDAKAKK